jgi:hypothetical protein
MRPLLKYGIPAAAGLATGGYALSQGEDPGSAALAGIAGGLGGAAGLLGARGLAGKYMPKETQEMFLDAATRNREGGKRQAVLLNAAEAAGNVNVRNLGKGVAAGLVPASALTAGLGGVALGAIPGSMGVPGFTDQRIDPESYGSSNSPGARYKQTTGTTGISNYQR